MTKKQEPINSTTEEWIPKTAHEIAVGMFHGLPNILVPARHHLVKVPGAEAKAAHKAVNRALEMVAECTTKFAKVPGPTRANFRDGDRFVIVETDTNRVTIDVMPAAGRPLMQQAHVLHRRNSSHEWVEVATWDADEWQTPGNGAFEAIIGVIAKITAGIEVLGAPDEVEID
jgi:hypothetical protein